MYISIDPTSVGKNDVKGGSQEEEEMAREPFQFDVTFPVTLLWVSVVINCMQFIQ